MTFIDLLQTLPRPIEELRELWLVMDEVTKNNLLSKQDQYGSPIHRIGPVAGPGYLFAVNADLCSEIAPGGLHYTLFQNLDVGQFGGVQIKTTEQLTTEGWFAQTEPS